jgi:branched-chain amino acid transport system ATP-binding protein
MTVERNLELASIAGGPSAHEEDAVRLFPVLGERAQQRAGTLSGGQQQMLALSRAFVTKPRLLMLDELSLGLAPKVVGELFERVAELHRLGTTIVLVEQYVKQALRLADFVAVLGRGRVQFIGEPGELRHSSGLLEAYLGERALG